MKYAKFECVLWPIFHYFIIFAYQVRLKTNLYLLPSPQKKDDSLKNSLSYTVFLYFSSKLYKERTKSCLKLSLCDTGQQHIP